LCVHERRLDHLKRKPRISTELPTNYIGVVTGSFCRWLLSSGSPSGWKKGLSEPHSGALPDCATAREPKPWSFPSIAALVHPLQPRRARRFAEFANLNSLNWFSHSNHRPCLAPLLLASLQLPAVHHRGAARLRHVDVDVEALWDAEIFPSRPRAAGRRDRRPRSDGSWSPRSAGTGGQRGASSPACA
jgi:hypothetical protein